MSPDQLATLILLARLGNQALARDASPHDGIEHWRTIAAAQAELVKRREAAVAGKSTDVNIDQGTDHG